MNAKTLLLIMIFSLNVPLFLLAQDAGLPSDSINESVLSPEELKRLQNAEITSQKKDSATLKQMYRDVNFVDVRNIELSVIADSGFSGNQNNFDQVSGYSFGVTWEFPILAKQLGGGTPILKARAGKTEISSSGDVQEGTSIASSSKKIDSLGSSEVYTVSAGAGYCYHVGFNCLYGLYNNYLTGQLSSVEEDGTVSSIPTQLTGYTVGMSSTFELFLGMEFTLGMEYSVLNHVTSIYDTQEIKTMSVVFGFGLVGQSRYMDMQPIEFVE